MAANQIQQKNSILQKITTPKNILVLVGCMILQLIIYCYFKYKNPSYNFKGKYYFQQVGPYNTKIMKLTGQYKNEKSKDYVIVCTSGNPGVIEFYDKFLTKLHQLLDQEIDIYAIGQIHHYEFPGKEKLRTFNLEQNLEHKKIFVQQLLKENPNRKFIFIGHSIGAFMQLHAMKVLKKEQIIRAHMLYPTVFEMNNSPSGKANRFIYPYFMQYIASGIIGTIKTVIPDFLLRGIISQFIKTQQDGDVIECIINMLSFSNSLNAMYLGRNEMDLMNELDKNLINENLDKCFYYFGTKDGWVPMSYVDTLTKTFPSMQYQIDKFGLEHAFVIGGGIKQAEIQAEIIKNQDLKFLFQKN